MGQKTVLLADDDPAQTNLIRRAFHWVNSACRLDVVHNGAEVIEYLFATGSHAGRDPKQMPNLILLDLKMSKMDGLQVLQVLRRTGTNDLGKFPPVVIFASSAEEVDVVEAYRLGAHSFVQKPVDFTQLVEAIRQIVSYWLGLNRSPPPSSRSSTRRTDVGRPGLRHGASRR